MDIPIQINWVLGLPGHEEIFTIFEFYTQRLLKKVGTYIIAKVHGGRGSRLREVRGVDSQEIGEWPTVFPRTPAARAIVLYQKEMFRKKKYEEGRQTVN